MRRAEVFRIDGGRLLVDLAEVVAIEHRHEGNSLVLYARGHHTFSVRTQDAEEALGIIDRWIERLEA